MLLTIEQCSSAVPCRSWAAASASIRSFNCSSMSGIEAYLGCTVSGTVMLSFNSLYQLLFRYVELLIDRLDLLLVKADLLVLVLHLLLHPLVQVVQLRRLPLRVQVPLLQGRYPLLLKMMAT